MTGDPRVLGSLSASTRVPWQGDVQALRRVEGDVGRLYAVHLHTQPHGFQHGSGKDPVAARGLMLAPMSIVGGSNQLIMNQPFNTASDPETSRLENSAQRAHISSGNATLTGVGPEDQETTLRQPDEVRLTLGAVC